jgi:type II secretion system protein G
MVDQLGIIRKRNCKASQSGFTLMELMIVMVILGILATMVIGAFLASQKKGRDTRRKSDLAQLEKSLEMFNADNGFFPKSHNGMIAGCNDASHTGPDNMVDCAWDSKTSWYLTVNGQTVTYQEQMPTDPKKDNTGASVQHYYYDAVLDPADPTNKKAISYQLYSLLEDPDDHQALTFDNNQHIETYLGTNCYVTGTVECNYGIASTNGRPDNNGHTLRYVGP